MDYSNLDYIGYADGTHYFRAKGQVTGPAYQGDADDYIAWCEFKKSAPVIDAGRCCSCPAMRICQVIIPSGSWNPYGGKGVKPCPGVL